ncbi:hypothetical protein [Streptomyces sp. NPDC059893]|uniref:hypothetical protein n=1 Tax=Streptomyces sp. NPDC059893 TaxID=3346990 RepID=UPI0036645A96
MPETPHAQSFGVVAAPLHGPLCGIAQSAVDADPALRDSHPCAHTRLPRAGDTEDDEVFLAPGEYALLKRRCASTRSTSLTASGALA